MNRFKQKDGTILTDRNKKFPHKSYSDVQLLQREFHNRNKFAIIFIRQKQYDQYVLRAGKNLGPEFAECAADEFQYLPHGYYVIKGKGVPDGEPIQVLMNLEKAMFKRNKIPSNTMGLGE